MPIQMQNHKANQEDFLMNPLQLGQPPEMLHNLEQKRAVAKERAASKGIAPINPTKIRKWEW